MNIKPVLIITILYYSINLNAQTGNNKIRGDSSAAYCLYREALSEYSGNRFDKALALAEEVLKEPALEHQKDLEADDLLLMAKIYRKKSSRDAAIKYYIRAISVYEKLDNKKELMSAYIETGDFFLDLNADAKALEYYSKAKNLSAEDELYGILGKIAVSQFNLQDYKNAWESYEKLLNSLSEVDTDKRLKTLSWLSIICNKLYDYENALKYDTRILEIHRQQNYAPGQSAALNNIGFDQMRLKNYIEAIAAFRDALSVLQTSDNNKKQRAELLINIGICYQNINDNKNTLTYLKEAQRLVHADQELVCLKAEIENIMSVTWYYKDDLYNAELSGRNAIASAKSCGDKELLQSCYYSYSQVLKAGNDFIKALDFYEMHLSLKDSVENIKKATEQFQSQENLSMEKTEKDFRLKIADEEMQEMELRRIKLEAEKKEKELDLLRKQSELEASEKERIMQSLVVTRQQHEAEIRNRELKSLEQEKAIQELQLKQKETEKKEKEKEIVLLRVEKEKQYEARKKAIYVSFLLALIGFLILIGLLMTRKKNATLAKQKKQIEEKNTALEDKTREIMAQTEQIVEQKQIIEETNRSITDSIIYAQRIQRAVLTPLSEICDYFADSFIFFRPRDIVSGDFYWGCRKENKIIITAADCTGHGVPGAFMSLLGSAFLNEIAALMKISDAAQVLNELRKNVITALRQKGTEGEANDGMDIALCVIDTKEQVLHFAGANNPLYFVRNKEIEIIRGDRMPIGIHTNYETPFTNHVISIKPSDAFYIFTDGLSDQFGGPDNKKFKSVALQQLLLEIHNKPFSEQQIHVEKAFDEWKGSNEQVDDVLLMGFKI